MHRFLLTALAVLLFSHVPVLAQSSQYFELPKGDAPHDVAVTSDGTVWYAGQKVGIAGRLDPATGKLDRIPLGANSAPHGVIIGPDGAPWFTDGGQNAIVRVDPATLQVKLWPLPPERMPYTNLNTAAFDGKGRWQGVADRVVEQRRGPVRPRNRDLRELPERPAERQCTPDAGSQGRGVDS